MILEGEMGGYKKNMSKSEVKNKMVKEKLVFDVAFCGLLRMPELLKKSISSIVPLRKSGIINRIIFSTWKGEISKNAPEMYDFLKKNNVVLIESEEPKDPGKGSIWCQMKSLEVVLDYIEPDRFLLRTRTDAYISPEFLRKINNNPEVFKITDNLPGGNLFQFKIWVPWYELTVPMYLADECFMGQCKDMRFLINYDNMYDTKYVMRNGPTHVRRFIHPFLEKFPILYESMEKYNKESKARTWVRLFSRKVFDLERFNMIRKIDKIGKFKVLKNKVKNDSYIKCLAAYYLILNSHFYIDGKSVPNMIEFKEPSTPGIDLDEKNLDNNFSEKKSRFEFGGRIYAYDDKLIKNIFLRKIEKTSFSDRLYKEIEKLKNSSTEKVI